MKPSLNQAFANRDFFAALVPHLDALHPLLAKRVRRARYHHLKDCLTKHCAMFALLELFAASKLCFQSTMQARVQKDMYVPLALPQTFSSRTSVPLDLFAILVLPLKTNSGYLAGLDTRVQKELVCHKQPGSFACRVIIVLKAVFPKKPFVALWALPHRTMRKVFWNVPKIKRVQVLVSFVELMRISIPRIITTTAWHLSSAQKNPVTTTRNA